MGYRTRPERTRLQAHLAAPRPDTMGGIAEQATIQRRLDDAVQANVMGQGSTGGPGTVSW